jgi:hypothetical protein
LIVFAVIPGSTAGFAVAPTAATAATRNPVSTAESRLLMRLLLLDEMR